MEKIYLDQEKYYKPINDICTKYRIPYVYDWTMSLHTNMNYLIKLMNGMVIEFNLLESIVDDFINIFDSKLGNTVEKIFNEWLDSGKFDSIISKSLNSKLYFKTTEEMIKSDIANGTIVGTTSYRNSGDGGGADFIIKNNVSEKDIYIILENGLYAVFTNNKINTSMLGARYNNKTKEIQEVLNKRKYIVIDMFKHNVDKIIMPVGSTIVGKGFDHNSGSELNFSGDGIEISSNCEIDGLRIVGNNVGTGIKINKGYRNIIGSILIDKFEYGFKGIGMWSNNIDKIWFRNCENALWIGESAGTSTQINHLLFENNGQAIFMELMLYSSINTIACDWSNGKCNPDHPYPNGYGSDENPVFEFKNCVSLNINVIGAENNRGSSLIDIDGGLVNITQLNTTRFLSKKENDKSFININGARKTELVLNTYTLGSGERYPLIDYEYKFDSDKYLVSSINTPITITDRTNEKVIRNMNNINVLYSGFETKFVKKLSNKESIKIKFRSNTASIRPLNIYVEVIGSTSSVNVADFYTLKLKGTTYKNFVGYKELKLINNNGETDLTDMLEIGSDYVKFNVKKHANQMLKIVYDSDDFVGVE